MQECCSHLFCVARDLLDLLRGPLVDFLQLLTPQNTCGKNWERITHLLLFSLETPNVQYMEQMFAVSDNWFLLNEFDFCFV